ncbi:MAG: hypothetical protein ABL901_07730 [Hyphomicrobiaceae bacterium]
MSKTLSSIYSATIADNELDLVREIAHSFPQKHFLILTAAVAMQEQNIDVFSPSFEPIRTADNYSSASGAKHHFLSQAPIFIGASDTLTALGNAVTAVKLLDSGVLEAVLIISRHPADLLLTLQSALQEDAVERLRQSGRLSIISQRHCITKLNEILMKDRR